MLQQSAANMNMNKRTDQTSSLPQSQEQPLRAKKYRQKGADISEGANSHSATAGFSGLSGSGTRGASIIGGQSSSGGGSLALAGGNRMK